MLSSDEAVKKCWNRRGAIYSDRQDMYIGQTLYSDGLRMLMMVRVSDQCIPTRLIALLFSDMDQPGA